MVYLIWLSLIFIAQEPPTHSLGSSHAPWPRHAARCATPRGRPGRADGLVERGENHGKNEDFMAKMGEPWKNMWISFQFSTDFIGKMGIWWGSSRDFIDFVVIYQVFRRKMLVSCCFIVGLVTWAAIIAIHPPFTATAAHRERGVLGSGGEIHMENRL